jgi:hypothetical protein
MRIKTQGSRYLSLDRSSIARDDKGEVANGKVSWENNVGQ